ncbi:MAG: nicotinate-nucleotide adenylyltransferase [Phascolarctobacterium sp.]|nr:nicotinate-nucleotide adenylyltransferase [Phascolarctobacterium sp.]
MYKKKLGILGGTFDPVHNGHIRLAQAVYRYLQLEKVIFIPAYTAPHKVGMDCASALDRYNMTALAVEKYPYFTVSDLEIKRSGISYTIDTITEMQQLYPEYLLYFIIGADSVPLLYTWNRIEQLLQRVTFVAAGRPGYGHVIEKASRQLGPAAKDKIILLNIPEYAVSSTDIRCRVKECKSLEGLVPVRVEKYIHGHRLYLFDSSEVNKDVKI